MKPKKSAALVKADNKFASTDLPLEIWQEIFSFLNIADVSNFYVINEAFNIFLNEDKLFWQRKIKAHLIEQGFSFLVDRVEHNQSLQELAELKQFYHVLREVGRFDWEISDQSFRK